VTEKEIVAYLIRWVMEFGVGDVPPKARGENEWYGYSDDPLVYHSTLRPYFTEVTARVGVVRINQAGLDLIRSYDESNN
jgi:hypothetical protein